MKEISVKTHNSISKIERYYQSLRRAYEIIRNKLYDKVNSEIVLQMTVKAVNDSAEPDGIVPILLIFGVYPRMAEDSILSFFVI